MNEFRLENRVQKRIGLLSVKRSHCDMISILMRPLFSSCILLLCRCCCWKPQKMLCLYSECANMFKNMTGFGTFALVNCFSLINPRDWIIYITNKVLWFEYIYSTADRAWCELTVMNFPVRNYSSFYIINSSSEVCYGPVNASLMEMQTAQILAICLDLHSHWNLMKDIICWF